MSDSVKTKRQAAADTIRPCTASNLIYKAYSRPYGGGDGAPVLTLLANGEYGSAPWKMFFQATQGDANKYNLMEHVPGMVYYLQNYPSACYSSQYGLLELGDTVTIVDASGSHSVPVEPFS